MKKKAAESHRILVEVYGEHALAERTCQRNGLHGLKVTILTWKTKNALESHQSLKMKNCRNCSIKIRRKRKKNLQNHLELLSQLFANV